MGQHRLYLRPKSLLILHKNKSATAHVTHVHHGSYSDAHAYSIMHLYVFAHSAHYCMLDAGLISLLIVHGTSIYLDPTDAWLLICFED